ncbi:hypothetical protein [Sphingobium cloacae]|uniref:Uncharacterized protein n=1 Tax=Sphingobium cloacae TaxID=120107 RepID=A0A1E1F2C7_9SPHN|nr:hypothetical protein [Sphingobium cloacae]BAV64665.1 hypothetical protein SCLO_1016250 [Sphingobium cloacae]
MPLGLAALDQLHGACEDLRAVLDGSDAAAIDAASVRIGQAAEAVRAVGVWRSEPAVADRLKAIMPLLEMARVRTRVLSDQANQKLALLAAHGSETAPLVYGR